MHLKRILSGLLLGLALLLTGSRANATPLTSADRQTFNIEFQNAEWAAYDYGDLYAQNDLTMLFYNGKGGAYQLAADAVWGYTDSEAFAYWLHRQQTEAATFAILFASIDIYDQAYWNGRAFAYGQMAEELFAF